MEDTSAGPAKALDNLGARARDGAQRVLTQCLALQRGDTLSLFYDETTADCAEFLVEAAHNSGLCLISKFVPVTEQIRIAGLNRLPDDQAEALARGRGILLCLAASLEATPYRKRLVMAGSERRLGTMPGATLEVLAHAVNVNYDEAWRRCSDLALAMLAGDRAILTSYLFDESGQIVGAKDLEMRLGAFKRPPITSPGIIMDGTWGNLPGGETFIAPLEGLTEGTFVLNGAFTGHVLPQWRPILLHFERGELANVEGTGPQADALREMMRAGSRNGAVPLGLAELGVGVNPGVGELKGNALFDEKKEGTAHIAVGDNHEYGGRLSASIHEDFITRAPSLTFDGCPILDHGAWAIRASDWREDEDAINLLGTRLPERFVVQRRGVDTREDAAGRLVVQRSVGAKRLCVYSVGADRVSHDLARAFRMITDDEIRFDLVSAEYDRHFEQISPQYLRGLIGVLDKHELVAVRPQDEDWN